MKTCKVIFTNLMLLAASYCSANEIEEFSEKEKLTPYWEFLLFAGPASADAGSSTNVTFGNPPNKNEKSGQQWGAWTMQAGIGYLIPLFGALKDSDKIQWFPAIQPQINAYYLKANVNGDIDRFYQYPEFLDNGHYKIDIESTRLMFDLALTLASVDEFSIYAIAGIGPAWNRAGYQTKEEDCLTEVKLDKHTSTRFAYEFGGGLTYAMSEHLAVTAEYLFLGIDNVALSETGENISNAESFDLHSQAVFLGFRFIL